MNQITDKPNTYDFGLSFNYLVWTPGTIVNLCNVAWDSGYRDVVRFSSRSALNAYLTSGATPMTEIRNLSYAKPNNPVVLNLPINVLMGYNYLRVSNPLQPVPGNDVARDYYYFILDLEYVAPNTTRVVVQLDVWQTYAYDAEFGTCYVERGHIGIANENAFDAFGRDYLTVPEGLDIGSDYRVVSKRSEQIMPVANADDPDLSPEFDIIVVATTDLRADPGDDENPTLKTGPGSRIQRMPSAATFYLFPSSTDFSSWLNTMRDYPWITQGIISATVMPKISRYSESFVYSGDYPQVLSSSAHAKLYNMWNNWRDSATFTNYITSRYSHLKKLWTYPYMVVEMTSWAATPIMLKPEMWGDANAKIMERINLLPPNQRVQFIPRGYNSNGQTPDSSLGLTDAEFEDLLDDLAGLGVTPGQIAALRTAYEEKGDDYGDYLDLMTQIANFPSLPVVNNMALSYLASNTHTIQHSRDSAGWTQARALQGADTARRIAGSNIDAEMQTMRNNLIADRQQTANVNRTIHAQATVNAISQGITGAGQGAIVGGMRGSGVGAALGAVAGGALSSAGGAINAGIQQGANEEALSIRNAQSQANTGASTGAAGYAARKNEDLAQFAARGDYANEIAAINARVQDAALIQPSMSGQFGGDMVNLTNNSAEVSVRWKMLDKANIRIVGEFWLRYGYAIRASIKPPTDLRCMTKFTYWKFAESYLIGTAIPEMFKNTIRGIFEKGVTVWTNPNDIGNIDWADNQPLSGISY